MAGTLEPKSGSEGKTQATMKQRDKPINQWEGQCQENMESGMEF